MGRQIEGEHWRDWIKEWGDRFLLFARQQAGSPGEAEDLLQDAIVEVWRKRRLFPTIEPGLVFLHIKRAAVDQARRDLRRRNREQSYADAYVPAFEHPVDNGLSVEVERALRQLPLEQREVIVLKVWGEQTFEAIGEALGISPNTAASRYRYGLDRMRLMLKGVLS